MLAKQSRPMCQLVRALETSRRVAPGVSEDPRVERSSPCCPLLLLSYLSKLFNLSESLFSIAERPAGRVGGNVGERVHLASPSVFGMYLAAREGSFSFFSTSVSASPPRPWPRVLEAGLGAATSPRNSGTIVLDKAELFLF